MKCLSCNSTFTIDDHGACPQCGVRLNLDRLSPRAETESAKLIARHKAEWLAALYGSKFAVEYERKRYGLAPQAPEETFSEYSGRIEREKTAAALAELKAMSDRLDSAGFHSHLPSRKV